MEEGRKRVLGIMASILVSRHLKTTEDLHDSRSSPRTESLVASDLQWAEQIMRSIDGRLLDSETSDGPKLEEIVMSAEYQWMAKPACHKGSRGFGRLTSSQPTTAVSLGLWAIRCASGVPDSGETTAPVRANTPFATIPASLIYTDGCRKGRFPIRRCASTPI
jgi:hypothetical protein